MQPMPELERISALIDHIYRGATEPALWPGIVTSISEWLGAPPRTRQPLGVDAGLLCRTYGLTHAEARVAVAATVRGSVQELADGLELGVNTVKTHLKQVYAKTAVGRRAELVRLVLGLASVH